MQTDFTQRAWRQAISTSATSAGAAKIACIVCCLSLLTATASTASAPPAADTFEQSEQGLNPKGLQSGLQSGLRPGQQAEPVRREGARRERALASPPLPDPGEPLWYLRVPWWLVSVPIVVIVLLTSRTIKSRSHAGLQTRRGSQTYKQRELLTANEAEFFERLQLAVGPGVYVFPQVAMSGLIEPAVPDKDWSRAFARISQKRVDYCICNAQLKVLGIVELDDRTHDPEKDAVRDYFTGSAGLVTVRFESRRKPNIPQLRRTLQNRGVL